MDFLLIINSERRECLHKCVVDMPIDIRISYVILFYSLPLKNKSVKWTSD